ncbi:DUF930 domain-containing protein [Roseibium sp.]|uniref:DUF930 domain-containing protein n=1 Tax=Roseibium sp. TaxID=1936156 RepID=UPI003D11121B
MGYAGTAGFHHLIADRFPWACAIWMHLAFLALLSGVATQTMHRSSAPAPISVELIYQPPAPALEDLSGPARTGQPDTTGLTEDAPTDSLSTARVRDVPQPDIPARSGSRAPAEAETSPTWVTATSLYAAGVLNDPRSQEARIKLATLTSADQADQICALEAMEQVRNAFPGFRPTRVSPHAFRNSYRKGNVVHAPAAALRSNLVWYEISYNCVLDRTGGTVKKFEYAFGKEIDRALWDEFGLAPVH